MSLFVRRALEKAIQKRCPKMKDQALQEFDLAVKKAREAAEAKKAKKK